MEEFPELDYSDEQLAEAVSKLDRKEYKQYISLRDQYLHQYRVAVGDNTWDWTAVDALVKNTKTNVDAVHTIGIIRGSAAVDALVKNSKANVDAVHTIGIIRGSAAVDTLVKNT